MAIVNKQVKVFIPNSLIQSILETQANKITKALEKAKDEIRQEVALIVANRLENSRIMKGLRNRETYGGGIRTVRAEFGLTVAAGQRAADRIIEIITNKIYKKSFNITKNRTQRGINITISYEFLDQGYRDQLMNDDALSYSSNSHPIEWMQWLLRRNATLDIQEVGIMYPEKSKTSRSRQAIMYGYKPATTAKDSGKVKVSNKPRKVPLFKLRPYTLPEEFMPRGDAVDFVDEALRSPNFTRRLKTIITSAINKAISRIQ